MKPSRKIVVSFGYCLIVALFSVSCDSQGTQAGPTARTIGNPVGLQVAVTGGTIEGVKTSGGLRVWQGIPYAAPPVGALRWQAPHPVADWDGTLAATTPGPICQQAAGPEGGFYSEELGEMSEDCLTLNVWSAAETTADALPVMYWIHGGGLTQGQGSSYKGDVLASKGVVLVTVNYRLGPFGFYAHPELSAESSAGVSGNQGIADQIAGLEWVKANIASFGGDPGNVTIFGESAGSLSVSLVQASPLAKGLFHRAIGQSGGSFQPMAHLETASSHAPASEAQGLEFAEMMSNGNSSLESARAASADIVLAAFAAFSNYDHLAIVDGKVIPKEVSEIFARGEQADVPVMIGSNANEGTTFLAYFQPGFGTGVAGYNNYVAATVPEINSQTTSAWPAANDAEADVSFGHLFADLLFTYPQRVWARGMESVSSPAYLYYFTWEPKVEGGYGAFHAADVPYVFGELDLFGATPGDDDREFSETISDLWVRFARTGNPNGEGFPEWPAYTRENESYMELGVEIKAGTNLRMEQIELLDKALAERRGQSVEVPTGGG